MKIITIVGARPQFIKAAPFSEVFRKENKEILIHTGQHYDENMSEIFFQELKIPKPDYNLCVGSGFHGEQTGKMLIGIEKIIHKEHPDGVLVYGDTNSTLAGALAASKLHVPVFHAESGLRSYNKLMPEEQNRVLTDHISSLLLCPTETAVKNLKREGIVKGVVNTGDIMYDAVLRNFEISKNKYGQGKWLNILNKANEITLSVEVNEYYLATIHRAENTDDKNKLIEIFSALEDLSKPVIVPIHPRTKTKVREIDIRLSNVSIVEPVGYLLMLYLVANSSMVITDSGGLQKEAYFLKTPCTTLRDQTEWVETLDNGWNTLSSVDHNKILYNVNRDVSTCVKKDGDELFGDGNAAWKMYESIINY